MTIYNDVLAPWSLFRDGTDDFAIILDANGEELVRSRFFWLPDDDDDPIPPTLAALRLMILAPKLLAALESFVADDDLADECGEWKWENLESSFKQARAIIAEANAVGSCTAAPSTNVPIVTVEIRGGLVEELDATIPVHVVVEDWDVSDWDTGKKPTRIIHTLSASLTPKRAAKLRRLIAND